MPLSSKSKHSTQPVTRREARERAMQVLYAYEISNEPIEMLVEQIAGADLNSHPEQFRFAQDLVYATLRHRTEFDTMIASLAKNWDYDRLALLDRIVLRIGCTEFLHFPDIPPKVTINEYVEIAKRYSTTKSGRFINGMLDAILAELKSGGRLNKTGRGLIDQ